MIDLHSHILPNVDDGIETFEDTMAALEFLKRLGFTEIIPTPHKFHMFFDSDPDLVRKKVNEIPGDMIRRFSFEYMFSFDAIKSMSNHYEIFRSESGWKVLLVEFLPFMARQQEIENAVFQLNTINISPLLAHIERYMLPDEFWEELKQKYSLFYQCGLKSALGKFFDLRKKQMFRLIEKGIVDNVSTDLHSMETLPSIEKGLEVLSKKFGSLFDSLFSINFDS